MLEVRAVCAGYGRVQVLHDVSFHVDEGECVALLGPNNAGKTTVLRVISGLLRPSAGTVAFEAGELDGSPAVARVRRGIVQVPEGRHVFGDLTAMETLLVGAGRLKPSLRRTQLDRVYELLPKLRDYRDQRAGSLSGGQQQMLSIGRALMADPRILLIDEPSLGLSPVAVDEIFGIFRDLVETGLTVLLVEQNAQLSLDLCGRGYLMRQGRIVLEQEAERMRDELLKEAYLG